MTLTVVAVGEKKPIITWYRNGKLVNSKSFVITHKDLGVNANYQPRTQSTLTINSPDKKSGAVLLAKAAYGDVSPIATTSVKFDVFCKYSILAFFFNASFDIVKLLLDFLSPLDVHPEILSSSWYLIL